MLMRLRKAYMGDQINRWSFGLDTDVNQQNVLTNTLRQNFLTKFWF